jgi:hypothetical protein
MWHSFVFTLSLQCCIIQYLIFIWGHRRILLFWKRRRATPHKGVKIGQLPNLNLTTLYIDFLPFCRAFRTRPFRWTRTQTEVRNSDSESDSDLRNRDIPTPWPKIQWNTYDVLTIVDICMWFIKGNNRILRIEISEFFCEMLTSLQYKCVNKQTRWVRVRRVFKVRIFGLGLQRSPRTWDSDSDIRKALPFCTLSFVTLDGVTFIGLSTIVVFSMPGHINHNLAQTFSHLLFRTRYLPT